ncbi:hypothetical protein MKEN_00426300 [Mycena kentingensis (nom. inval.)]|nr:hypothetical protein MKEN_00426300 [Mycena kentingensis (nom. inval.)]
MTEYDYSAEGRRRYEAKQRGIASWTSQTHQAMSPTLGSRYGPPSAYHSSHSGSRSSSSSGSQSRSHYYAPPGHPGSMHPPSMAAWTGNAARRPPTVFPSDSISQSGSHRSSHSSSRSSGSYHGSRSGTGSYSSSGSGSHHSRSSHHSAGVHRISPGSGSYIISRPPPPPGYTYQRTPGMVIFPQKNGRAPHVVYY